MIRGPWWSAVARGLGWRDIVCGPKTVRAGVKTKTIWSGLGLFLHYYAKWNFIAKDAIIVPVFSSRGKAL